MNANRAISPAFPLPGTNYQAQPTALSQAVTYLSPPNVGIVLREHVALTLLTTFSDINEQTIARAFWAADLFLKISEETMPKPVTGGGIADRN